MEIIPIYSKTRLLNHVVSGVTVLTEKLKEIRKITSTS